ncbi:oxidoreductase [Desulfuromonas versatilis]|uniref:Oxidoreductase n=1 Tax=Desulfuromonas versatilis TaxID=2802975 RepID=A0ABN6DYR7_9BACT|nr:aldo/keto reductase [Desulfuromonas versatilis]BCR04339.1 oxidoreductase [Desulfuromonas versatilis]
MNLIDYPISRRTFVGSLAAALASLWFPPTRLQAAEQAALRKTIPGSGESLPVIGLGTSRTFDTGDETALRDLAEVLRAFFASGGELIDSSPMYGESERVIGALLERIGRPQRLFAATKVWTDGEQAGIRQMEDSRQKWGIERFDLMQIHNLRDWRVHLKTLHAWKAQGKIRYTGITTSHGRDHRELEQILSQEKLDFVQFSYNIEDRDAERRLLPLAAERGMAVLVNRPYQRGELFRKVKGKPLPDWAAEIDCSSWGQFFLKFIVSHPAVTCAIPATAKLHHMRDNMAAGFGRLPDAAMRRRMVDYYTAL